MKIIIKMNELVDAIKHNSDCIDGFLKITAISMKSFVVAIGAAMIHRYGSVHHSDLSFHNNENNKRAG